MFFLITVVFNILLSQAPQFVVSRIFTLSKYSSPEDHTRFLQNLIDKNREIFLGNPNQTFYISQPLKVPSNKKIYGNKSKIIQTRRNTPIFDCSNQKNVTFSGLSLIGYGGNDYLPTSSSLSVGIYCYGASNLIIENSTFTNFSYSAVSGLRKVKGVTFRNNLCIGPTFTQKQKYPKDNTGVTLGGKGIKIYSNKITNTSQGIIIAEESKDIEIVNNKIYDLPLEHGIYIDASCNDIKIERNQIWNVGGCGMKVQNRNLPYTSCKSITISNNFISNTTNGDGILIINTESNAVYAENIIIQNNTVDNSGQDGISIRIAKDALAKFNVVNNVKRAGIYLSEAYNINLYKNDISNTGENGIFDEGTGENITMEQNKLRNLGLNGNDKNGLSSGILIQRGRNRKVINNSVIGNPKLTQYAIYIPAADQSTMVLKNNEFRGAREYGARFSVLGKKFKEYQNNVFEADVAGSEVMYKPK